MSFRPFLRARRRLLVVPLCAAATLGSATFAAADTRVSIQNGPFASGLDGRHVLIRDINSVTHNEPLDVTATRDGNTLIVRDDAGDEVPGDGCTELGGTVRCSLTGVLGLRFEGSQLNDVLTNATSLLANYHAGPGHDLLEGGSGRDEMAGNDGNDTMNGGEGNDVFTASETTNDGADIVRGQGGTDTMRYGLSEDPIFVSLNGVADDEEGDNIDTENLSGSRFGDTIVGSDAANALSGGDGNDNIQGGNGDDTINGGRGADAMHGQAGADVVTYADQTAPVEVTFDDIGNDGNANDGSGDKVANTVETVLGGAGDDELSAADAGPVAKRLVGNGGADALDGGPGPDRLEGGPGEDRLDGGGADDTVFGGDDADEIRDFSGGNDTMDGQGGDDSVNGGSGADTMLGGPGADHLRGAAGNDTLDGGSGEDLVSGDTDDDTVRGGADADTVQGETGNDIVEGGPGNDKLDGYEGADVLDGGADNDSVTFVSTGNVTVTLDNGLADDGGTSDQVNGVGDEVRLVEKVFTGPADDILIGDDDAETLSAGEGDDIIEGNGGADTLIGGRGADELTGGPGVDAMSGNEGDDRLFARDGERDEPIACGEDIGDLDADLLEADLADVFSETVADCETVELP